MGEIFNKGLKEDDQKEGLLKRLKYIEDKDEKQLKIMKNKTENRKEVTDFIQELLSLEGKALIEQVRTIQKHVNYRKLKLEVVTMLRMILLITKHLKSYLVF